MFFYPTPPFPLCQYGGRKKVSDGKRKREEVTGNKEGGRTVGEQATVSQTQGIAAEFAKRSEVNWSGKPDPAQRGCAQKPNIKANITCQPRMQAPFSSQRQRLKPRSRYASAERIETRWRAPWQMANCAY
jgi:hypothetical protein